MARTDVEELMRRYALAGVKDWQQSRSEREQRIVERELGAKILVSEHDVGWAVGRERKRQEACLVPARGLTTNDVNWAFFVPRREVKNAEWMFDLIFWLPEGKHICFRLEPADREDGARHGYSHVQLSWRFNGKQSTPRSPLKWLPDSYPAFPIPGKCSLDRFLMLVVALHGFPACTRTVLDDIWTGRASKGREYFDRVQGLLGPTWKVDA